MLGTIGSAVLGAGAVCCGVFTTWCIYANNQFSYDGKHKLSKEIIDGIAEYITLPENCVGLDVSRGDGANVKSLLGKCPNGTVKRIDNSEISVWKSRKVNDEAIKNGRCEILQANVMELPFEQDSFDIVTAFGTIYFWPDLLQSFRQVYSVLKSGGIFFIYNEFNDDINKDDKSIEKIGGMTTYSGTQIKAILEQTGFSNIRIDKNEKVLICVISEK